MVKNKVCLKCGSLNCEESTNKVSKKHIHLYPPGTKQVSCYLCYDCGASEVTYA